MGFLETIGQRHEPRPQGLRPAAASEPGWDDSYSAPWTAPAHEPRRSNRTPVRAIWTAVVFVIAAVGVAAWLGIRNMPTVVAPTPPASDGVPVAEQTQAKSNSTRPATRRRNVVDSRIKSGTAIDATASDAGVETAALASASDRESRPLVPAAEPAASAEPSIEPVAEDNFVYSSEGTGVTAPRLVSLGFIQPLVKGFETRTSTLELLVSKTGTVERAKISSRQRNWEDAMLLSRAKTFQFVPAQRNGQAVRYRLVMRVDTVP